MPRAEYDVAIVGAGLAGLAAAQRIKSQGLSVVVLESQARVGGRVFTHHTPTGTHFERGAFAFGNGEQPLRNCVNIFALPIIEHKPMEKAYNFEDWKGFVSEPGKFLNGDEGKVPLFQLMELFRPKLEQITEDIPFSKALCRVGASEKAIRGWKRIL